MNNSNVSQTLTEQDANDIVTMFKQHHVGFLCYSLDLPDSEKAFRKMYTKVIDVTYDGMNKFGEPIFSMTRVRYDAIYNSVRGDLSSIQATTTVLSCCADCVDRLVELARIGDWVAPEERTALAKDIQNTFIKNIRLSAPVGEAIDG